MWYILISQTHTFATFETGRRWTQSLPLSHLLMSDLLAVAMVNGVAIDGSMANAAKVSGAAEGAARLPW